MPSLRVSREEALRLLNTIPHATCVSSIATNWEVDPDGHVRFHSVCWLFCWGTTGMGARQAALRSREVFGAILDVSFDQFDAAWEGKGYPRAQTGRGYRGFQEQGMEAEFQERLNPGDGARKNPTVDELKAALEKATTELAGANVQLAQLNAELAACKADLQTSRAEVQRVAEERPTIEDLEAALKKATTELDDTNAQLRLRNDDLATYKADLQESKKIVATLTEQLKRLRENRFRKSNVPLNWVIDC